MQTRETFYLHKLREALSSRQRKNSSYSLRAFAKDLEIDSSNLSAILQKKRSLPQNRAKAFARKLKLSPKESALFVSSTIRKQMRLDSIKVNEEAKNYLLDEKYYKVISEWEYYAFLQLLKTDDFQPDVEFISSRLGISTSRARLIIENLISIGLIERTAGHGFRRLSPSLETSEDIESQALQESHSEALRIAVEKLERIPVGLRDFSSVTMAIDPKKLPKAKAIVREFQEKLYALLADGKKTEVYQFNCQLFPLTQKENEK